MLSLLFSTVIIMLLSYLILPSSSTSVPVTWQVSQYFRAGSFSHEDIPQPSGLVYNVPFTTALNSIPLMNSNLAISLLSGKNIPASLFKIRIEQTSLSSSMIPIRIGGDSDSQTIKLRIQYLIIARQINFQISSNYYFEELSTALCPFSKSRQINFTASTQTIFPVGNTIAIIPFLHMWTIKSTGTCFDTNIGTSVTNISFYQVTFSCSCADMQWNFAGYSRLIFDKSKIELQSVNIFQYAQLQAQNDDPTTLDFTLQHFGRESFIVGMNKMFYNFQSNYFVISFSASIGQLTSWTTPETFIKLSIAYWSLKQWVCPQTHPYYYSQSQLCYLSCPAPTYPNSTISKCQLCPLECTSCNSPTQCLTCDTANHYALTTTVLNTTCTIIKGYFKLPNGTIDRCYNFIPNCIDCTNTSICLQCNINLIRILPKNCRACSLVIAHCIDCKSSGECTKCNEAANYYVSATHECMLCDSSSEIYYKYGSYKCQTCSERYLNCLSCSNNLTCINCESGYYLINNNQCKVCSTTIPGCIVCSSPTVCTQCNSIQSYYLSPTSTCIHCNPLLQIFYNTLLQQCQKCSQLQSNCQQCQDAYSCIKCYSGYYQQFGSCHPCNIQGCIECRDPKKCDKCEQEMGLINGTCMKCLACGCYRNGQAAQGALEYTYTQEQCEGLEKTEKFVFAIKIICVMTALLSVLCNRLVGIQMIGVLQLAHLTMKIYPDRQIPLNLAEITTWSWSHGGQIETDVFGDGVRTEEIGVSKIGYSGLFLKDVNIMVGIMFVFLIGVGILGFVGKGKLLMLKRIMKEIFLSLLLFNCFNISFSLSLYIRYSWDLNEPFWLSNKISVVICIVLYVLAPLYFLLNQRTSWGQYSKYFKQSTVNQMYISLTVTYRFILPLLLSSPHSQAYILCISLPILFLLFNLINLPFRSFYHNYRAILCHTVHVVILSVCLYYQNLSFRSGKYGQIGKNGPALFEIIAIFFCVGVSLACIFYQVGKFVQNYLASKRTQPRIDNPIAGAEPNQTKKPNSNQAHPIQSRSPELQTNVLQTSIQCLQTEYVLYDNNDQYCFEDNNFNEPGNQGNENIEVVVGRKERIIRKGGNRMEI